MWTASSSDASRRSPSAGTGPGCWPLSCPRGTPTSPFFEYPVQLANGRWRYPDVAYPPPVLVGFEAQSYEHHSTLEAFAADVERNLDLFGEGWMIVPITGVQLRDPPRLVALMARIIAAAEARHSSRALS